MCCVGGKVVLEPLASPPEPVRCLLETTQRPYAPAEDPDVDGLRARDPGVFRRLSRQFNNALALASEKVRAMVWAHAYAWSTGRGLRPPQTPPPPTFHAHK